MPELSTPKYLIRDVAGPPSGLAIETRHSGARKLIDAASAAELLGYLSKLQCLSSASADRAMDWIIDTYV